MAYHLGRILDRDFGIDAVAVAIGDENAAVEMFSYDLAMPLVSRDEMERQITDQDLLIVNPGFSRFLFGWRVPGFKISYVQGFTNFKLLDRRINHYVAASEFVQKFLKTVYALDVRVVPPFINLHGLPSSPEWLTRPASIVLPYRKGLPEIWELSFRRLQSILAERAPHITLSKPIAGSIPQRELLSRIGEARYFLTLSAGEGFGLVPLEAMAMGSIVVGYDGFGGMHYMRPGENCSVAPYPNIEDVATLLIDAVRHPERSAAMSHRARKTAREFTYDSFCRAWINEFRNVLKVEPLTNQP
jgi:hypothetical protein